MRTYRYLLTAEVLVKAPNIMAAEAALKRGLRGVPWVKALGSHGGSVRLPSMRPEESCAARVLVGPSQITRNPLNELPTTKD